MSRPRRSAAVCCAAVMALSGAACGQDEGGGGATDTTLGEGGIVDSITDGIDEATGDPGDAVDQPSQDLWGRLRWVADDVEAQLSRADESLRSRFAELRAEVDSVRADIDEQGGEVTESVVEEWSSLTDRAERLGDDLADSDLPAETTGTWERFRGWLDEVGDHLDARR